MSGEISNLISYASVDELSAPEQQLLRDMMRSGFFLNFAKGQARDAEKASQQLDPNLAGMNPDKYFQLAKDLRLVSRFWLDLLAFAEDWKPTTAENGDET